MELAAEYESNGVFSRLIDSLPDDGLRHGYEIETSEVDTVEHISQRIDDLNVNVKLNHALKMSRLFGGAVIVMIIDDGKSIQEPLDIDSIHSLVDLRVYDMTQAMPDTTSLYMVDEKQPWKTGEPELYDIQQKHGGRFKIHASRCLIFKNGETVSQSLYGEYEFWGLPEYFRNARPLRNYIELHDMIVPLMKRSAVGVFKTPKLNDILSAQGGEAVVKKKMSILSRIANRFNFTAISSEEDVQFAAATFSGLREMLQSAMADLSATSRHPQTKLFGTSPGGLQATGESDTEFWHSEVEAFQEQQIKPAIMQLLEVLIYEAIYENVCSGYPDDLELKFNPLEVMSELEIAQLELQKMQTAKAKADTAEKLIDLGIYDTEEIREDAHENGGYGIEIELDEHSEEFSILNERTPYLKKLIGGL